MATPRDYLVSLGLAKPGRGKFSAAGHEALAKARADGMVFDEVVKIVSKTVKTSVAPVDVATVTDAKPVETQTNKSKPADRPIARNINGLMIEAAPRYMHDEYSATDLDKTKIKRTYRDVCNGCAYSIRWCRCFDAPSVWSHVDTSTRIYLRGVGKVSA